MIGKKPSATGGDIILFEREPVDFATEASDALRSCGWRVHRQNPSVVRLVPTRPIVVAGGDGMASAAEPSWRAILTSGSPVLALVRACDFERAEWTRYATDVIIWPPASGELAFRIGRWLNQPIAGGRSEISSLPEMAGIIGKSPVLLRALEHLPNIAASGAPVLITGETGTGKDLVARALHYGSARKNGPFVPVNCGALPESLFENELFGHAKGAYTHAADTQAGLIAHADHGTLFLDEIDALSLRSQAALLRFLQDGQYWPLGSGRSRTANVRVLAATNRPLKEAVSTGQFRCDLFYRLNILAIALPPLRARREDIRLLADAILARLASDHCQPPKRLSEGALRAMERQDWPGNVRELESSLHRAFLITTGPLILSWPPPLDGGANDVIEEQVEPDEGLFHIAKREAIKTFERRYLLRLIDVTAGNVTVASRIAGTERRTLGRLLSKHGIDPAKYRGHGDVERHL